MTVELIPGWANSKVKKKLEFEIPGHIRNTLLRLWELAMHEYVGLFFLSGSPSYSASCRPRGRALAEVD